MSQVTSSDTYRKRVLAGIEQRLDVLLESEAVTDFSAEAQQASVNAAVDALQAANRVNDRVDAFFSIGRVRSELGDVSRQAVDKRVRSHRLLRVETADGVFLFPAFQFTHGGVLPGLPELLQVLLGSGADGWTVAYWLTARNADLANRTALEVLAAGNATQVAHLRALAADDAAGWAA